MVSSTGKFISNFQKNKKKDYPALIMSSVCISNGYRKTIHTGTYTETHTEPTLEPALKNTVLGFRPTDLGFTKSRWWWHGWNELYVWFDDYLWDSTTKIQQKPSISKFSRISATNPPTKCYTREPLKALWSIRNRMQRLPVEKIPKIEGVVMCLMNNLLWTMWTQC